jgi:LPXTG-motif cell wall-anchored protein
VNRGALIFAGAIAALAIGGWWLRRRSQIP